MKAMKALIAAALAAFASMASHGDGAAESKAPCRWPAGKKAAFFLSFDDGCPTQVTNVFPLLTKYRIPGTFYVCPGWNLFKALLKKLDERRDDFWFTTHIELVQWLEKNNSRSCGTGGK